ncbi:uncharacterized protein [Amphiura filiformis]|uniref:uncharacterized protein n=1 Tax=Amphiura filiformis TaxID=82378 RepID=UPI003B211A58
MHRIEENGNDEVQNQYKLEEEEGGKVREVSPPCYQSMCEACRIKGRIACQILMIILFTGSFIGFSIANICIGVAYMEECPSEPLIPIFLIVFGAAALLIIACMAFIMFVMFCTDTPCCNICAGVLFFILVLFYLAWLGVGTYWCATLNRNGDPESDTYCNYTLYAYLVSDISISYVLLLVFLGLMICCRDCWCKK